MRRVRHGLLIVLLALAACDDPRSEAHAEAEDETRYTPTAVAVVPAEHAQKLDGIATLISPDTLAQLNADIRSAEISASFSKRAYDRYKVTKSLPEHFVDNAARQAQTDQTQVALLDLKLRNTWGEGAPFLAAEERARLVNELSSGKTTLVRLDFPRAVERDPRKVQVAPLSGGEVTPVSMVWPAPSGNLAMPGTSFFALMPTGPGLRPGDRAKVTAEGSATTSGVVVPASAVVVHAGQSWCYVETAPGQFERRPLSLAMPVADGYVVADLAAGTKVVNKGASVLLAREADPAAGDDDDDDGDEGDERPARKAAPAASSHKARDDEDAPPGPQANTEAGTRTGSITAPDPD